MQWPPLTLRGVNIPYCTGTVCITVQYRYSACNNGSVPVKGSVYRYCVLCSYAIIFTDLSVKSTGIDRS